MGGVPRRAGLGNHESLWPSPVLPDLYLVGDSVFPGQSTLAATVGGARVAERIARERAIWPGSRTWQSRGVE